MAGIVGLDAAVPQSYSEVILDSEHYVHDYRAHTIADTARGFINGLKARPTRTSGEDGP